jgi:ABC-type transport system substrate-binding protein
MMGLLFSGRKPLDWQWCSFGHGAVPGFDGIVQEYGADPYNPWYDGPASGWGDDGAGGGTAEALAVQSLLKQARREADPDARYDLIQQAQVGFAEELPVITVYRQVLVEAYRTDRFSGWNPTCEFDGLGRSNDLFSTPNMCSLEPK